MTICWTFPVATWIILSKIVCHHFGLGLMVGANFWGTWSRIKQWWQKTHGNMLTCLDFDLFAIKLELKINFHMDLIWNKVMYVTCQYHTSWYGHGVAW
jgi:hypothetical protein